jgi:hypothetical protein
MTIALGINLGNCALVAADTRVTYYNWFGKTFNDDNEKVQKTKIGLITGAGSVPLLDEVKQQLKVQNIINTNDILRVIKEARINYTKSYLNRSEDIEVTGWIFTYLTKDKDNKVKMRVCIAHPSISKNEIGLCEENKAFVISPVEATKEQASSIAELVNKAIKPFETLQESIQYHSAFVAQLIKSIQPMFPSTSPFFQIGIHTFDGRSGITHIIKDESDFNIALEETS